MTAEQPEQVSQPEQTGQPEPPRRVTVRRSPRYGVFIVGGALLGAVAAVVLTYSEPATQYGYTGTLGYLLVALGSLGALLGASAAVLAGAVLDRRASRRANGRDSGRANGRR